MMVLIKIIINDAVHSTTEITFLSRDRDRPRSFPDILFMTILNRFKATLSVLKMFLSVINGYGTKNVIYTVFIIRFKPLE